MLKYMVIYFNKIIPDLSKSTTHAAQFLKILEFRSWGNISCCLYQLTALWNSWVTKTFSDGQRKKPTTNSCYY